MSPRRRGLVAAAGLAAAGAAVTAERLLVGRPHRRALAAVAALPDVAGDRCDVTVDDGGRLAVLTAGAGRPVVLVHGLNLSSVIWRHQLAGLSGGFTVVAYDQRGHGRSAAAGDSATGLPRLAADLAGLLDRLDLSDAVLVGHSLGGMVSLQLAQDHREVFDKRIGALLLLSTSAGPLTPLPPPAWNGTVRRTEPAARRALEAAAARSRPFLATGDLGYLVARVGFGARPRPVDVELTRGINFRTSPVVLAGLWDSMLTVDLRRTCRALQLPTLIAVGSRDLLTPPRMARAMARAMPGAELVVLPGAGHMAMLEQPAEVNGLIRRLAAAGR